MSAPEQQEGGETATPPMFAHRRLIDEIKAAQEAEQGGLEKPQVLELAQLMALDQTDEAFVRGLYAQLLGRDADSQGLANYLAQLPRLGRLGVLATLLSSEESRTYRDHLGIRVDRQRWLLGPLRGLERLGPLARLLRYPLFLGYRIWEKRQHRFWRLELRHLRTEARIQRLHTQMISVMYDVDGQLDRLDHFLQGQQANTDTVRQLQQQLASLRSTQHHWRRAHERSLQAAPVERPSQVAVNLQQDTLDAYYLAFEEAYRGSEEAIRSHLRHYLVQLDQARRAGTRAIDLGCGRGEWLALLAEEGFTPWGIDLNIAMVEHCRDQGFEVSHQDALSALRELPDASQALVSGFHIAEHLPFDTLYALVDEAHRVLAPGGVLILETPNPENLLVGSHTFYHDPTHRNPLTPTAMRFLLSYHGFGEVVVRRFNPHPEEARLPGEGALVERLNGHFCAPQDFAVVGLKAAPHEEGADR